MSDSHLAAEYFYDAIPEMNAPSPLPEIEDAFALLENPPNEPEELIVGILHQGSKMVLGGSSKTNKTWVLIDLALSVATGAPWFRHNTRRTRVLYVNMEIQRPFFARRVKAVADAKSIELTPSVLDVWHLRGHCAKYQTLLPMIADRVKDSAYGLVILDPIYKLSPGDENAAKDINALMNAVEKLAVDTGAAIAIAAHFSKGNQATKESIDRISGSGVFGRDPDTILTLTRHEQDEAFVVEATLRNQPPLPSFGVKWIYPLMRRDDDLDPKRLREHPRGGREAQYSDAALLEHLPKKGLKSGDWQKLVREETGISSATFYSLLRKLKQAGTIARNNQSRWKVATPKTPKTPKT